MIKELLAEIEEHITFMVADIYGEETDEWPKTDAPTEQHLQAILAELKKYEGYRGYRELEKYKRYNNNYY